MKNKLSGILLKVIKKQRGFSFLLILVIIGSVCMAIIPPLILERIVNDLTGGKAISFLMIIIYLSILIISGVLDCIKEGMVTIFGQRMTHGIRSAMSKKLIHLKASYYVETESGVITSKFVNDVDTVENLFTVGVISMAADICSVISIITIIFIKSLGLGLIILAVLPILFLISYSIQKKMLSAQKENRTAVARANNQIPETIKNFQMIRTFHAESYLKKKYANCIEDGFSAVEKSNFYDAIYSPIIITLSAIVTAAVMICASMSSGMQMLFGISVGSAVAIISYISKVFEPIEAIGMEIQNIQSAIAGISKVNDFLEEEEREVIEDKLEPLGERNALNRTIPETNIPAINFEKVDFAYEDGHEVLHQYDLSVKNGERVTLTGRTGIGKSTIFKLILGLYTPKSGKVLVFGRETELISDEERSKVIGYVEQSFHPLAGSIKEQITLKNDNITDKQVEDVLSIVELSDCIATFEKGINTEWNPGLFSQGQLQLLSIARAIVNNPPILLLDEITANLDSETERKVLNALKKASENRTVLSISHRINNGDSDEKLEEIK